MKEYHKPIFSLRLKKYNLGYTHEGNQSIPESLVQKTKAGDDTGFENTINSKRRLKNVMHLNNRIPAGHSQQGFLNGVSIL